MSEEEAMTIVQVHSIISILNSTTQQDVDHKSRYSEDNIKIAIAFEKTQHDDKCTTPERTNHQYINEFYIIPKHNV